MKTKPPVGCMVNDNLNRAPLISDNSVSETLEKQSLLLHSCCGPCSSAVIEGLADEFNITVFFYNPCITDSEEYQKRKATQIKFIEKFNESRLDKGKVCFKEGPYDKENYFLITEGLEVEPEGGKRCTVCFRQRLERTAEDAGMTGFDLFGTTLTVSPHKNYRLISQIGGEIALRYGISFLDRDFKKKDGFKRSIELSKKYDLYRQNYCGCVYSKR